MTPESCPNCGADVPRGAAACPECGADERTGWSDEAHASGLGLPDDSFDYDQFVEHEFGGRGPSRLKPQGVKWHWWVVALVLAFLFVFGFILLRR